MSIKRYTAVKDNTITNAYGVNKGTSTRATGSNMGAADILEVFSIYGQQTVSSSVNTASVELSRTLIKFPISSISSNRAADLIPQSGSVEFYLRLFNARHSEQLPRDYTVNVLAVSQSWEEGNGLDMEGYSDKTKDLIDGSNWTNRAKNTLWTRQGGEYHSSSYTVDQTMPNYTYTFEEGDEDLELDVTAAVEEWLASTQENYGFGIFLTSSYEGYATNASNSSGVNTGPILHNTDAQQTSFYTKRFFSRTSEFFFKKPVIEARWDSSIRDDRGYFFYSSSLAPASDNLNTIYLYNYVRGELRNIPAIGRGPVFVSIYSGSSGDTAPSGSKLYLSVDNQVHGGVNSYNLYNVTGGFVSTGIYSASFAFTGSSTLKTIYDIWHSGSVEYKTGSIRPKTLDSPGWNQYNQYVTKITNLKSKYVKNEHARFRVFTRPRNLPFSMSSYP